MRETTPEVWMSRAVLFELLALAFLVPRRELAESLTTGDFREACLESLEGAGCSCSTSLAAVSPLEEYRAADGLKAFHSVRREHTRLFVGTDGPLITPYAGVWDAQQTGGTGLLFANRASMEIERFMKKRGIVKNTMTDRANVPMDHLGTLCEFLKYLSLVNAQAIRTPRGAIVEPDDFEEFFTSYFRRYALWCANSIDRSTKSSFYVAVGRVLVLVCEAIPSDADA